MIRFIGQSLDAWVAYREVFARFGEKWSFPILLRLADQDMRFNELHRELNGVSKKVLAQTLRSLERDGVILRKCMREKNLGVSYNLTELGWSYVSALAPLAEWASEIHPKIVQAQFSYEQLQSPELDPSD